MATEFEDIVTQIYQEQLGREPDEGGLKFWSDALANGAPLSQVLAGINQSVEGQNYDTQYITSLYRQILGRNPEQEGFQYWLSEAQAYGYTPDQLKDILGQAALVEQQLQGITGQTFTNLELPDLEADPYGGRYITNSIYDLLPDAVNVSQIGGQQVQFVAPVTQQAVVSSWQPGGVIGGTYTDAGVASYMLNHGTSAEAVSDMMRMFNVPPDQIQRAINLILTNDPSVAAATQAYQDIVAANPEIGEANQLLVQTNRSWVASAGQDVLNTPQVQNAVQNAINSGAMTPEEYQTMYSDIQNAQSVDDLYAAFNAPKAQVVIDAVYGQQIGEANTIEQALAESVQRQNVLNAVDTGYYQSNPVLAQAYQDAGLYFPFGPEAYQGYDSRTGVNNLITDENFRQQVDNLLGTLYGRFGGAEDLVTPLTGQYYSETGIQPGYTTPGGQGTMFRSGVAGYTPNLPSMFQFGAPPVDASYQVYSPGAFQPEGVTTGGFITGYTNLGEPIYSTLANPNVNVVVPSQMMAAQQAWETGPITAQNFNAQAYLQQYPDVAASSYASNPYQHYLDWGINEDRNAPRLPFNTATYVQPSQLNPYNPAANILPQYFTAPNGQIFASEQAYNATQGYSSGG